MKIKFTSLCICFMLLCGFIVLPQKVDAQSNLTPAQTQELIQSLITQLNSLQKVLNQLLADQVSVNQNSMYVVAPSRGENFYVGDTITIKWKDDRHVSTGNKTNLYLVGDFGAHVIANNISIGASGIDGISSYQWKIPDIYELYGQNRRNVVKINVSNVDYSVHSDSDEFIIKKKSDNRSISSKVKVLYPNGRESIDLSKDWIVSFTPRSVGELYSINLFNEKINHSYRINPYPYDHIVGQPTDKQSVTITGGMFNNYDIQAGNRFKIEVCNFDRSVCDKSNNYFSIVTPKAVQPVSSWKTYKNDSYDFEVKYPQNWKYEARESDGHTGFFSVAFYYNESMSALIRVYPNETSLDKFISNYQQERFNNIKLDGVAAKELVSIGNKPVSYVSISAVKDSYGYELVSFGNVDIVRNMVSTFRFVNSN